MQLRPCSACKRHVAIDAASCPFCAASLVAGKGTVDPPGRLSRAAVFAAGVAAAAAGSACWTNKSEPQHVQQQTTTVVPDAAVTPDGAVVQDHPVIDERHYQNHPCADTPQGPVCAPYGAPPMRRRVV